MERVQEESSGESIKTDKTGKESKEMVAGVGLTDSVELCHAVTGGLPEFVADSGFSLE